MELSNILYIIYNIDSIKHSLGNEWTLADRISSSWWRLRRIFVENRTEFWTACRTQTIFLAIFGRRGASSCRCRSQRAFSNIRGMTNRQSKSAADYSTVRHCRHRRPVDGPPIRYARASQTPSVFRSRQRRRIWSAGIWSTVSVAVREKRELLFKDIILLSMELKYIMYRKLYKNERKVDEETWKRDMWLEIKNIIKHVQFNEFKFFKQF